jgi:hypothetical protein
MVNGIFPGEIKASTTVAGCIDIFENAWPNPSETIKMVEEEASNPDSGAFWEQAGTVTDGPFQNYRTNKLMAITHLAQISGNPVLQNIHNQLNLLLLASTIPYAKRLGIQEPFWHEGYNLLKYRGGEEYKAHYDGGTAMARAVSALVYLNNDYKGGELEFQFRNQDDPTATRKCVEILPRGSIVVFPSFVWHRVKPVTKGTRYSLVLWNLGYPFK